MHVKDLIVTGDARIIGNLYTNASLSGGSSGGSGEGGAGLTYTLSKSGNNIVLTGSDGSTSSVTDTDTNTDTNTTYTLGSDSNNYINLNGSDNSLSRVQLIAGTNITLTPGTNTITINAPNVYTKAQTDSAIATAIGNAIAASY